MSTIPVADFSINFNFTCLCGAERRMGMASSQKAGGSTPNRIKCPYCARAFIFTGTDANLQLQFEFDPTDEEYVRFDAMERDPIMERLFPKNVPKVKYVVGETNETG